MKNTTNSINKIIKSFDKELKNLLVNDLKVMRLTKQTLVKTISKLDTEASIKHLKIA